MNLTDVQLRVLGALIEKQMTTPDGYPLTLNSLLAACNQRTNRDPVVDYTDTTVIEAINGLRDLELCRLTHVPGQRAVKYKQALTQHLELEPASSAAVAVLLLRGPQTPGELRTRTGRYHDFSSPAAVEATLDDLARREPPLVMRLERQPGEKEHRWVHLVGTGESEPQPAAAVAVIAESRDLEARIADLEREVTRLRELIEGEPGA